MTDPPTRWSFRPGPWFGVFGDHVTVLLPGTEKARVAALWELVDAGAGFDEVLDALVSGGLRGLPGFVLLSELGAETKVVVRGAARAALLAAGERVELEGSRATTWVERSLSSVTAVRLEVEGAEPDAPEGPPLAVVDGLVRVSLAAAGAPMVAATPPTPVAPAPPSGSDHDGHTRAGDADPPGRVVPASGPTPRGPVVGSRPVARLALSSGETVDVDRTIVVGRAPEVRRVPAGEQPRLLSVPSPLREISSTHAEFRPGDGPDQGSAVVTDLGSTNGTVLLQPGLPPEELHPGIAAQLVPGAIVDLGDGVTIQVLSP